MVSSVRKATQDLPTGTNKEGEPSHMPVLQYLGEGDGFGHSLCLRLELQRLFFSSELNNALEKVLMTIWHVC